MPRWYASAVLANSVVFSAGQTENASTEEFHTPAVCVKLESLEGNADDTITIDIVGDAAEYEVDSRTLSATGSYVVDVPQANTVKVTSQNGTQLSVEARNNPR